MNGAEPLKNPRRDFLRACARYGLLGAMGLAAVRLGSGRRTAADGEACLSEGLCRGCRALDRCSLPGGVTARHALDSLRRREAKTGRAEERAS